MGWVGIVALSLRAGRPRTKRPSVPHATLLLGLICPALAHSLVLSVSTKVC